MQTDIHVNPAKNAQNIGQNPEFLFVVEKSKKKRAIDADRYGQNKSETFPSDVQWIARQNGTPISRKKTKNIFITEQSTVIKSHNILLFQVI
jgi:hypothetical protein